jgi:hypothetical protein
MEKEGISYGKVITGPLKLHSIGFLPLLAVSPSTATAVPSPAVC